MMGDKRYYNTPYKSFEVTHFRDFVIFWSFGRFTTDI